MKFLHLFFFAAFLWYGPSINGQNEFITVWKTDISDYTAANQLLFPGIGTNYNIAWEHVDDATINGVATGNNRTTITFPAPGTYRLKVSPGTGSFTGFFHDTQFYDDDNLKLLQVELWGNIAWTHLSQAFYGCSNMNVTATDTPDLSHVTNLSAMFEWCRNLTGNSSFNLWNTSNITVMSSMFQAASLFNQNISDWETGNVTNMGNMFASAEAFNQPIGDWDVRKVQNFQYFLSNAHAFNQPLNDWETNSATNMIGLFSDARSFNQPLNNWQVSTVTSMSGMFMGAHAFNQPLNNWDVSNVSNMTQLFFNSFAFNQSLGDWTLRPSVTTTRMFQSTSIDCVNWDATLMGWAANTNNPSNITIDISRDNHIYSLPEAATARNYLLNTKGWTFNGAMGYDPTCNTSLGVDFGNISASIRNGAIYVIWETLKEENNAYFEVEASTDGTQFQPLGKIQSKAKEGNSNVTISYDFKQSLPLSVLALAPILALLGMAPLNRKKKMFLFALLAAAGLFIIPACSKSSANPDKNNNPVFVRIAQTDIDGRTTYSKVIKAVKE